MTIHWGDLAASRHALALAVVALALAAWGPTVTLPLARFHGIVVIDVTQSMNVEDYAEADKPVSRLSAAKTALREALAAMPCGSRVGLGIFTEYRTLVLIAPLETCAHFRELRTTLENIDGRMSWAGRSEVAKGLYWALRQADLLPGRPAIVFMTDGHEAPPVNPAHRPYFDGKPGKVAGLVVGTGGLQPMPIPKFDPDGRRLGFWSRDEVQQLDSYTQGRSSSVAGEKLAETDEPAVHADWATSGSEELSSLRERYLQVLAQELKLGYLRLDSGSAGVRALTQALTQPALAARVPTQLSLGYVFGTLALALLAGTYGAGLAARLRPGWRRLLRPRTLRPGAPRSSPGPNAARRPALSESAPGSLKAPRRKPS